MVQVRINRLCKAACPTTKQDGIPGLYAVSNSNSNPRSSDSSRDRELSDQILPNDSKQPENEDSGQSPLSKHRQAEYREGTALQLVLLKAPSCPPGRRHRKFVKMRHQTVPFSTKKVVDAPSDKIS